MGNNDCVLFLTKQQKKVPDAKGSSSSGPIRIVVFRHFVKASIYCCKGSDTLAVFEEEPTQDVGSEFFNGIAAYRKRCLARSGPYTIKW